MRWQLAIGGASLLVGLAFADAESSVRRVFSFDGKATEFVELERGRLVVSRSCLDASGKPHCQAARSVRGANLRRLRPAPAPGVDTGAVICERQVKGRVVLGTDPNKNESAFCLFKDGSLIDTGSLSYYGGLRARAGD